MSQFAVRAVGLGKQYRIGQARERYKTLRDQLMTTAGKPLHAVRRLLRGESKKSEHIWALRDVTFDVRSGEVIGVIGSNGAGKSTLLKVLSRITEPSAGYADVYGRVSSLLEVGTGFHPELTGRDNIYLNGAVMGMKRSEITRRFDEIVDFAGVEKFLETPVKRYSSGMYLRLAFAVAAHMDPEVLFVDEVLAVGDASFQKKCIGKMSDVARDGRTVLFVSHNMGAVRELCQRAIWLSGGNIQDDGGVEDVVQRYMHAATDSTFSFTSRHYDFEIEQIVLRDGSGAATSTFEPGDDLEVEISFHAKQTIRLPYIWLSVTSLGGPCFAANMILDGRRPAALDGRGVLKCRFNNIPLLPQSYTITAAIRTSDGQAVLPPQEIASFAVTANLRDYGFEGDNVHMVAPRSVPVVIPYDWIFPDGSVSSVKIAKPVRTETMLHKDFAVSERE
ncbi:MAG: ABC transporter ATP-binding protein [Acidobacteriota bacterium]